MKESLERSARLEAFPATYLLVEHDVKEVPESVSSSLAWKAMSESAKQFALHGCRVMSCSLEYGAYEARKEYGDEIDGRFCCLEEGLLRMASAGWECEDVTSKLAEMPYSDFFRGEDKSKIVKVFLLSKV